MRSVKKLLLIALYIAFVANVQAQTTPESSLEVGGMVEKGLLPLANAVINIYENGKLDRTIRSGMDGEFKFKLNINTYYRIEIGKDNMITKSIEFDTKIGEEAKEKWVTTFAMSLFEGCEGVNTSFFDKPVDVIKYNKRNKSFESDKAYVEGRMFENQEKLIEIQECQLNKQKEVISKADQLFREGKIEEARELYEKALEMFPSDRYPKKKLDEIALKLNNDVEQKKKYEQLIAEADQLMAAGDINAARLKYSEALKAQPQNNYPREKITSIDKELAAKNANDRASQAVTLQYQNLMDRATAAFAANNYIEAKSLYQQALALKPGESLPAQKMKELEPLIVQQQQVLQQKSASNKLYAEAIAMGDKAMMEKNYKLAEEHYQRALSINPSNPYPRQKIDQISNLLLAEKNQQEQELRAERESEFNKLINQGDVLLDQKNYEGAKAAYQQALKIKPEDRYAQNKLNSVNNLIVTSAADKQAALERNFSQAMTQGDSYKLSKQYALAIQSYQSALELKPGTPGVQAKIDESKRLLDQEQQLLAGEKAKRAKFDELIGQADQYLASRQLDKAKALYQQASSILPNENYPKNKLAEIDNILATTQKDATYTNSVAEGDKFFAQKDYSSAKIAYQRALSVKPTESYPQLKINEIGQIVNQNMRLESQNREQYQNLIKSADAYLNQNVLALAKADYEKAQQLFPLESYPKDQIAKISLMLADQQKQESGRKAQYQQLITQADQLFNQNQLEQAKSTYLKAASLQPDERYPKQQIAAIDIKLAEQTQLLAMKQSQYQQTIQSADSYFNQRNYISAKSEYEKAQLILPKEQYPVSQLNKINALLAEQAKEIGAKKDQYNQFISQADQLMNQNQFDAAKSMYLQASVLLPSETYPKQKIAEIDSKLREIAQAETQKRAEYQKRIQTADNYFNQNNYSAAKLEYAQAQKLLPTENYPATQLRKIDALIADQQKQEQTLKSQYNQLISQADQQFTQKQYQQAQNSYTQASALLPSENYPKQKIAELNGLLAEQNRLQSELLRKKSQYNGLISEADNYLNSNNLPLARSTYLKAQAVLPDEKYPATQIVKIDGMLAEQQKLSQNKAELERKYNEAIALADQYYSKNDFQQAKAQYQIALSFKPAETYPQNKMAEADRQLNLLNKKKQYNDAILAADRYFNQKDFNTARQEYNKALLIAPEESYPRTRINEISQIEVENARLQADNQRVLQQYQQYIQLADRYFNEKNYELAKVEYSKAKNLNPNESYPRNQIVKIDALITAASKANADQAELDRKYANFISQADAAYRDKLFDQAKSLYSNALSLKPTEAHPKMQISKIDEILAEQALTKQKQDAIDKAYNDAIAKADAAFAANNLKPAREFYLAALEAKAGAEYPRAQIRKIEERERFIAQRETTQKSTQVAKTNTPALEKEALEALNFSTETERNSYLTKLKTKYPEGMTLEIYTEKTKVTNRFIIIRSGEAREFRYVKFNWGGTEYSLNGKPITSQYYEQQTQRKSGEAYQEFKF